MNGSCAGSATHYKAGSPVMLRDDAIKALEAQGSNVEVQVLIGDLLVDIERVGIERVEYVAERDVIVLRLPTDDLRDAIRHFVAGMRDAQAVDPGS
jgi:hypothetical protein